MYTTNQSQATLKSAAEFHIDRLRSLRGRLSFEAQRRLDQEIGQMVHERDLRDSRANRKEARA